MDLRDVAPKPGVAHPSASGGYNDVPTGTGIIGLPAVLRQAVANHITRYNKERPPRHAELAQESRMGKFQIAVRSARWMPNLGLQVVARRRRRVPTPHLLIAVADHFEPNHRVGGGKVTDAEAERRLELWCRDFPAAVRDWPDGDGRTFRHTYFYPAEQCKPPFVERIAEHCRAGWGEMEIHLHHGVERPDNAENTRRILVEFRDYLASLGCLARAPGGETPLYAFVHGNWALANSNRGRCCGVDNEMEILAQTGCYADLTLPSAPNPAQIAKINSIYECALPLQRRAPHRRGRDLRVGQPPRVWPIIIQGPLMADFTRRLRGLPFPQIEKGELTAERLPSLHRLRYWIESGVRVVGRPDWVFIKLYCHGMVPGDAVAMHGGGIRAFLQGLSAGERDGRWRLHYVSAREMTNIALAACDGRDGDPGQYRNYRLLPWRQGAGIEV